MKKIPSWEEFLKNKKPVSESIEKKTLETDEFPTKDSVGYRMDSDYKNDPKEYEKLQKFIKGTNKPDPIPSKDGWFVVDEGTGQVWYKNDWVSFEQLDDISSAIFVSEKTANVLANVVSGVAVQAEGIMSRIGGGIKKGVASVIGHEAGKDTLSSDKMAEIKWRDEAGLKKAVQAGDPAAIRYANEVAKRRVAQNVPQYQKKK